MSCIACREWALADGNGEALTQKKLPKLATIRPSIDLQKGSIHPETYSLSIRHLYLPFPVVRDKRHL